MILVSEIVLPALSSVESVWDMPKIETDTDSLRVLSNQGDINGYIAEHGNCLCWLDGNTYIVPELSEARGKYIDAKRRDCARYGCE